MNRLSMFLWALAIVGVAEFLVMLLLPFLGLPGGIWKAVVDAAVLVALSAPFLYVWVARGVAERLSEKYIQGFLENARDLVQSVTPEGRFLYVNRAWRETLGYREDEVPRLSLFDIIHPDHRMECRRLMQRALGGEPLENVEAVFVAKDGRNIFVSGNVHCVFEGGKPMATQAIFRDVTDRKQAETEKLQLLAAIEQASDAVIITNLEGQIQYVNSAFTKITGYGREEVLAQNSRILKSGQHDAAFYENLWRRIGAGEIWQNEIVNRKKDGTLFAEWMTVTPVRDGSGKIANYIAIQEDISERKRAEREIEEANRKLKSWLGELERRNQETTLLNEIGDLLLASISPEEAHAVIAQYAQRLFPEDSGALFAISASRDMVEAVTVWGQTPPRNRVFATGDCWALRRGRLHSVETFPSGLVCKHLAPTEEKSYLCVPMMAQGEALGVLHVQAGGDVAEEFQDLEKRRTENWHRLAVTVAEHLALALANLNLRDTLRTQSIRDPLTGLFNRRYMEESLEREMRRAARNQKPLGAIMIDIDHFKRFNDTFGHEAGDTLLRAFGVLLQKRLRGEDIACRYGGEEFTLILPEAALEVVRQRGEELRERAKHLDVQHLGRALGAITLSLGIAVFPEHGTTPEAILRAADAALYRAKSEGRDRVVAAETATE